MSTRLLRGAALLAALVPLALTVVPAPARGQPWRPSVSWNTYLGGGGVVDGGTAGTSSSIEDVNSVATNALGEVFVVGDTYASSSVDPDAFVTKFNADGGLAWTRVFGGTVDDYGNRVALTPSGTVYVVGTTRSSSIRVVAPSETVTTTGSYSASGDAYLARLTRDGQVTAFVYLGASGEESGYGLAVDPSDERKVYVAGKTTSAELPGSDGGRENSFDAFVALVDFSRTSPIVWSRYITPKGSLTSSWTDEAHALAIRGDSLYVGGVVEAEVPGIPRTTNYQGADDGFVARLSTSGSFQWIAYLGGSSDEKVVDILPRADGGLVVVGNTNSTNFPTPGSSGKGAFVLRMTDEGVPEGNPFRVGAGNVEVEKAAATLDSLGNIYLGGTTNAASNLFTVNGFDSTLNSTTDGFILMLDSKVEKILWSSYVGGSSSSTTEWVVGLSAGPGGQLTFGGRSSSTDVLRVDAGYDLTWNGEKDGVVFRLEVDPTDPVPGSVDAGASPQGRLTPSWEGFSDPQTDIIDYAWAVTSGGALDGGVLERDFQSVGTNTFVSSANGFQMTEDKTYFVTVRASNGVGRTATATSGGVQGPPDAGSGSGSGIGTDAGLEPVDPQSPLGWGCGSTGGSGLVGALGLVALAALMARRARRAPGSER